jgi:hypothetical protein
LADLLLAVGSRVLLIGHEVIDSAPLDLVGGPGFFNREFAAFGSGRNGRLFQLRQCCVVCDGRFKADSKYYQNNDTRVRRDKREAALGEEFTR